MVVGGSYRNHRMTLSVIKFCETSVLIELEFDGVVLLLFLIVVLQVLEDDPTHLKFYLFNRAGVTMVVTGHDLKSDSVNLTQSSRKNKLVTC